MDFIERFLGIAPDHGDGRLEEALILMVLIALITGFILYFFRERDDQLIRRHTVAPSPKRKE
jgi:hypothetical protein